MMIDPTPVFSIPSGAEPARTVFAVYAAAGAAILPSLNTHCVVCRPARLGLARVKEWGESVHAFTSRHFVTTITLIGIVTAIGSSVA
ncbi:MAG: hypothetical protein ABJB78_08195 [Betaproteobacteria bacterium]